MTPLDPNDDPDFTSLTSPTPESIQSPLPTLTSTTTAYHGCCLALSTPLVTHLASLLKPPPHLTLSVGSGYGLLEALLLSPPYSLNIVGVEVQPSSNRYLPPTNHREVAGSRSLHKLAGEAEVWMFVYPRRVGIIEEYLEEYGHQKVQVLVWVGPRSDWEDYKDIFGKEWKVHVKGADEVGGRAWEMIAIARRRT